MSKSQVVGTKFKNVLLVSLESFAGLAPGAALANTQRISRGLLAQFKDQVEMLSSEFAGGVKFIVGRSPRVRVACLVGRMGEHISYEG